MHTMRHTSRSLTLHSWQTKLSHNNIHTACPPLPQTLVTLRPTTYITHYKTELCAKVHKHVLQLST